MKKIACMLTLTLELTVMTRGNASYNVGQMVADSLGYSVPVVDSVADQAARFMNSYLSLIRSKPTGEAVHSWIAANETLTSNFKRAYKRILDSALRIDPDLGLGFDPILNAQDYPDEGFELFRSDKEGYVTLKGRNHSQFVVTVKVIRHDSTIRIDGAGVVNIPREKQAVFRP